MRIGSRWIVGMSAALAACGAVAPLVAQTDGTQQWAFATQGMILSSAAVAADGTVIVGSESNRLWAIRPDGSLAWRFPDTLLSPADWFDAAPAIADDGSVYAGNFDGNLYALRADGTQRWVYETYSYIISSVAIGPEGTLYFGAGDGALHAVNPDGTGRWQFQTGDWVDSSPAIGADGTIYFGSWDNTFYAVAPDGSERWRVVTGDAIQSSPAIGPDATIYFGSADERLYAVRPDGTVAWTFQTGDSVDASPVVGPDGTVYFGSADGNFYALHPDGTPAWAEPFWVGQGVFGGALIRADGTIVFGASDRYVYALNANGTLKWRLATGDIVDASPAIGPDGTIYLGSYDTRLYAIHGDGSGLVEASWAKFRRDARNQGRIEAAVPPRAPAIAVQPLSLAVAFGTTVTLSVGAEGTLPMSFQWQRDGEDIVGATQVALVLESVDALDAGSYRVSITNAAGTVWSAVAVLTVEVPAPPAIVSDPRPLTLAPGARLSLWVEAAGSEPLLYEWRRNGMAIAEATEPFYEIAAASAGDAGTYTVVVSNAGGGTESAPAAVAIDPAATSRLGNLSARAVVGTGDGILIPGFALVGSAPRRLLVRAVGPTLATDFDVSGVLADPALTVFSGSSALHSNDDWGAAENAAEIAAEAAAVFAFPLPADSADAAAVVELGPQACTVQVFGVGGTTGVALVELYDCGAVGEGTSRLGNFSARAAAGAGDRIVIAGFVVDGNGAKTLLIRAVGPTLSQFGVGDRLADPLLRLFEGPREILANDDWTAASDPVALAAAAQQVFAFALEGGSADAAMLVVLMPGTYTAQASGAGGATGNVLVEIYEVP